MGLFDSFKSAFRKVGSAISSGARKVGEFAKGAGRKIGTFVKEGGIQRVLGKAGGIAKKVGGFINRPEVQGVLTALQGVPYVGRVASILKKAGAPLEIGGALAEAGSQFGTGVQQAIEQKNLEAVPGLLQQGQGLFQQGAAFKGQFRR